MAENPNSMVPGIDSLIKESMVPGNKFKLKFENIIVLSKRVIIFLSKMGSFTFSSLLVNSQTR